MATEWLLKLLQRRPRNLAAVALANKMARIAWAMMTSGEAYRHQSAARAVSAGPSFRDVALRSGTHASSIDW